MKAKKTGVLILGGGVVKHHILNANIWRNGADFGVFVNVGTHHDGSEARHTPGVKLSYIPLTQKFGLKLHLYSHYWLQNILQI